ncbi:MAG: 6,7-dimethyl-8-ribityllumazine synthase [Chitinophagaceae bacterium]
MSGHNQSLLKDAGIPDLRDAGVVLVSTEWNEVIVNELVSGCEHTLREHGINKITKIKVPGAIELPFACKRYFESKKDTDQQPDAMIIFGCVIRGDTPHFDYVCQAVTQGTVQLNLKLTVPVIFGVLTVNNIEQAQERTGGKHGHKGEEAAITALKMIAFNKSLF